MPLPSREDWSELKSNAGIAKSPWYKKADADVGPALDKMDKAKDKWKKAKTLDNARQYQAALGDLHKAFQKFLHKKDLSAAGDLKAKIEGWVTEVEAKHEKLAEKIAALKEDDKKQLAKILDDFVL